MWHTWWELQFRSFPHLRHAPAISDALEWYRETIPANVPVWCQLISVRLWLRSWEQSKAEQAEQQKEAADW
jgi:hypothetical protein